MQWFKTQARKQGQSSPSLHKITNKDIKKNQFGNMAILHEDHIESRTHAFASFTLIHHIKVYELPLIVSCLLKKNAHFFAVD